MRAIVFALVALLACTAVVSAEETCLDLANKLQVRGGDGGRAGGAGGREENWRPLPELQRVVWWRAVPLRLAGPPRPIGGRPALCLPVDGRADICRSI